MSKFFARARNCPPRTGRSDHGLTSTIPSCTKSPNFTCLLYKAHPAEYLKHKARNHPPLATMWIIDW